MRKAEAYAAADGGYLVGRLAIGEAPSFIILDADPATDFEVLLDTDAHTVFAVHDGELRRFNLGLEEGAIDAPAEEPDPLAGERKHRDLPAPGRSR